MGRNPILTPNGQSFRFFVNGEWKEILVDCYLPCLSTDNDGASLAKKRKFIQTNGPLLSFSRAKRSQLWVSLLEKAYAKLYGYYDALHGGHIPEALFDLTGDEFFLPWRCLIQNLRLPLRIYSHEFFRLSLRGDLDEVDVLSISWISDGMLH